MGSAGHETRPSLLSLGSGGSDLLGAGWKSADWVRWSQSRAFSVLGSS